MGRYLEIFRRTPAPREKSEVSEITCPQPSAGCEKSELSEITHSHDEQQNDFSRLIRFFRELERRCPLHINPADWQQALDDGPNSWRRGANRQTLSVGPRPTCSVCTPRPRSRRPTTDDYPATTRPDWCGCCAAGGLSSSPMTGRLLRPQQAPFPTAGTTNPR